MYEVVGQQNILNRIKSLDHLPQTFIIKGKKRGGKKLIANLVALDRDYDFSIVEGNSLLNIRELRRTAANLLKPTLFYIDGNGIGHPAQNALLKLAEEPRVNVFLCIGVNEENYYRLLPTIISRSEIFSMDNYTINNIKDYYNMYHTGEDNINNIDMLFRVSPTPGILNEFLEYDFDEFYKYVNKVYTYVLKVHTSNAFKIGDKLNLKKNDFHQYYNLDLFFMLFKEIVLDNLTTNFTVHINSEMLKYTEEVARDLSTTKGINKALLFDYWLLNIRRLRGELVCDN